MRQPSRLVVLALATLLVAGCFPRVARYDDAVPGGSPAEHGAAVPQGSLAAFIHRRNPALAADDVARLAARVATWSARYGLEARLVAAVVSVESAFDTHARSGDGATGLGQLMPGTARSLGVDDATDPDQNLMGTCKYLADLLGRFHDTRLALAGYNAGEGAIARQLRAGRELTGEQRQYVERVMGQYVRMQAW